MPVSPPRHSAPKRRAAPSPAALEQAQDELRQLIRSPERAKTLGFDAFELKGFLPQELFAIFEQSPLKYITIGAFGALLHGSGVLSENIDIVPSPRPANLHEPLGFGVCEGG